MAEEVDTVQHHLSKQTFLPTRSSVTPNPTSSPMKDSTSFPAAEQIEYYEISLFWQATTDDSQHETTITSSGVTSGTGDCCKVVGCDASCDAYIAVSRVAIVLQK